jgi:lysyl-tRNA synthetase class 2
MSDAQDSSTEAQILDQRRQKLATLRERGNAYPNDFRRDTLAADLHAAYGDTSAEVLAAQGVRVALAGRMMTRRVMGKAAFANLRDMSGQMQIYVKRDVLGEEIYQDFKHWDLGDIVGAEGTVFRTNAGELSVQVDSLRLLTKSLRPMPEKFHGLTDQEVRYRQRYLDLMTNDDTRRVFAVRSRTIDYLRRFLGSRGARLPVRSLPITTHSICSSICASRPSCISSDSWLAAWSGYSKSIEISATRGFPPGTIPNSPCSSSMRPMRITAT